MTKLEASDPRLSPTRKRPHYLWTVLSHFHYLAQNFSRSIPSLCMYNRMIFLIVEYEAMNNSETSAFSIPFFKTASYIKDGG